MTRCPCWVLFIFVMLSIIATTLGRTLGVEMTPSLLQLMQLLPTIVAWPWRTDVALFLTLLSSLGYLALYAWFGITGAVATAILVKRLSDDPPDFKTP